MPDGSSVDALVELGLTEVQARVYAALLAMGPAAPRDVSLRSGLTRTRVYAALATLAERGLARAEGRRYVARPVAPLLDALSDEAAERLADLADRREALLAAYRVSAALGPREVRLLRGRSRVEGALASLVASAARSLDAEVSAASFVGTLEGPLSGPLLRDVASRLASVRMIVHAEEADLERLAVVLGDLRPAVRLVPAAGFVADRVVADADILLLRAGGPEGAPSQETALLTRHPGLVADAVRVIAWSARGASTLDRHRPGSGVGGRA